MKFYVLTIVGFMVGTISYFHSTLEYKNVNAPHSCYGECYEEYVKTHGTLAEQMAKQAEAAAADEFSSSQIACYRNGTLCSCDSLIRILSREPNTNRPALITGL